MRLLILDNQTICANTHVLTPKREIINNHPNFSQGVNSHYTPENHCPFGKWVICL